ncbi:MAG: phage tail assembly chaperone [Sphingomonadaceae bacterium]|nr:phage tail assembly chaperone [Sphingomonadaceae bacterium]
MLGWSPEQFWRATVGQFLLAVEGRLGSTPEAGDRALLERLMREFPDG